MSEKFTWLNGSDGNPKKGSTKEPSITPSLNNEGGTGYRGPMSGKSTYAHNPAPLLAAMLPAIAGAATSSLMKKKDEK
mgnify:CR=1 FL=1